MGLSSNLIEFSKKNPRERTKIHVVRPLKKQSRSYKNYIQRSFGDIKNVFRSGLEILFQKFMHGSEKFFKNPLRLVMEMPRKNVKNAKL